MSRTILIGDVHGCFDEFFELVSKLNINNKTDTVLLTGDLVHKGPASNLVIDYVIQHNFKMVLGNHDDFFLRSLLGEQKPYDEFLTIMGKVKTSNEAIKKWFLDVPLFIKGDNYLLIHAGLDPKANWLHTIDKVGMMNLRYWDVQNNVPVYLTGHDGLLQNWVPWYESFELTNFEKQKIFYGHFAKKAVQIHRNGRIIGLDTGCCYGGALSAYILEEDRIIQVSSKQKKQFDY